jgi:hypothetical protein
MITSASEVFWSVNFGEVQKLKAVLIIGELSSSGEYYTANGLNWFLTFGNSNSRCTNPTIYSNTSVFGAKEIVLE